MQGELRFVVTLAPAVVADDLELQRQVRDLAEYVSRQNLYLMRRYGRTRIPPLYESGLRYRDDQGSALQRFPNALECLQDRWINCRGAVPYLLAERRLAHPDQHFAVHSYARRVRNELVIHLQLAMPGGVIEDPSRFLRQ